VDLHNALAKFGCQAFGTMTDQEKSVIIVQFKWRDRKVSLEANWKGYAAVLMKAHPYKEKWSRVDHQAYQQNALDQGRISVCSVLRDWVKGQITAVECGIMSFEAAFMPHILLPTGERIIDRIKIDRLLTGPNRKEAQR